MSYAALVGSGRTVADKNGQLSGAIPLASFIFPAVACILPPCHIAAAWPRKIAFGASTVALMWRYSITAPLVRSAAVSFERLPAGIAGRAASAALQPLDCPFACDYLASYGETSVDQST